MNADVELMLNIYKTYNLDWMNDKVNDIKCLTKHHIVKKEKGGLNDISNYALLTDESHHLIHLLEVNYNKEYNELNRLFKELNTSLEPPTDEYYQRVKEIIKFVKKDIKRRRRGKIKSR